MIDPQLEGATFHTEFTCHGTMHRPDKMTINYDTAEHYTGESTYSPSEMMSLKWKRTFVGQWTGPTCASPCTFCDPLGDNLRQLIAPAAVRHRDPTEGLVA